MLPKKVKKNINLSPEKTGIARRYQLLEDINDGGTFLPKSLLHEDLDGGFLNFVKEDLKTTINGKVIPVVNILLTSQNWAQFTQTWDFNDLDKNSKPPFITTIRQPEVKFGTIPSLRYNIPNRKQYYYAAVPTWDGTRKGLDIYTIPQPVPVDIKYTVKIICNRMRELNLFNQVVIEKFASRQAYTQIKGHYIPIQLDEISDESVMDLEKRRYYIQSYGFTLQGFLIDEKEFEVKPAISRVLMMVETQSQTKKRKIKKSPENPNNIPVTFNYPVGTTSFSKTFEYTNDLVLDSSNNISSYSVYINDLYYGSNITQTITGKLQLNVNDTLRIDIVKDDGASTSNFEFTSILL